jgi:hypothetical protein
MKESNKNLLVSFIKPLDCPNCNRPTIYNMALTKKEIEEEEEKMGISMIDIDREIKWGYCMACILSSEQITIVKEFYNISYE